MQAKDGEFICQRITCQRATPINRGGSEKLLAGAGGLQAGLWITYLAGIKGGLY